MIGLLVLIMAAYAADLGDQAVFHAVSHCCSGGFTKQKAMRAARSVIAGRQESVKFIVVTSDVADTQRIGASDQSYAQLKSRWLSERRAGKQLLSMLVTPTGSAVEYWSESEGVFERIQLSGENPFLLSESTDLLGIVQDGSRIHAYAVSRNLADTAADSRMLDKLRSWAPGRQVVITIGETPTHSEALDCLPLTPHLAFSGATEREPKYRRIERR